MKILYFGSLCDEEWFTYISKNKKVPSQVAQYSFEKALVNGFAKSEEIDVCINYLFQEQYYPKGMFLIFKSKIKKNDNGHMLRYLPIINLPIVKEVYMFIQGFLLTFKWSFKNRKEEEKVILTPFNYTPLSLGIYVAAKLFGVKRLNIFTDLTSDILSTTRQKNMPLLKRIIRPIYLKFVNFIEHNYDGYILFSEPMNTKVNPLKKPHIVMEGIYNNDLDLSDVPKSKALMYAGTLAYEYGIKNILDAFEQINDDSLELWLFGDGDMKEYIEELCTRDNRVKYFGFKSREEVFEYEKKATLLINIRDPKDSYTKYSFPSKTFEYMVSGTPFLTTKLKGIPEEYFQYLFTIESINTIDIKTKIEEIFSKKQDELKDFGLKAREFILQKKGSSVQVEKIKKMIKHKLF